MTKTVSLYSNNPEESCQYLIEKKDKTEQDYQYLSLLKPKVEEYNKHWLRYQELFLSPKFWNRRECWIKTKHDGGWIQPKKRTKVNNEKVKKPDDPPLYAFDKLFQDMLNRNLQNKSLWVGLKPNLNNFLTTVDVIDADNSFSEENKKQFPHAQFTKGKNYQGFICKGFFSKLKMIYDNFPNRIWCISSSSGGVQAWQIPQKPIRLFQQLETRKQRFAELNLTGVEQFPNFQNCLRRPMGEGFAVLAPNRIITNWQEMMDFFDNPLPLSFEQIIDYLTPRYVNPEDGWIVEQQEPQEPKPRKPKKTVIAIDQHDAWDKIIENQQFALNLENIVLTGLTKKGQVDKYFSKIAIWLYWVELENIDKEIIITEALTTWIENYHNGFCTDIAKTKKLIKYAIKFAKKPENETVWLKHIRDKQKQGKYKRVIRILPLLITKKSNKPPNLITHYFNVCLFKEYINLPEDIKARIEGTKKYKLYALNLINVLLKKSNEKVNLSQETLMKMGNCGNKAANEYNKRLIKAGILEQGKSYSTQLHYSKAYNLTQWAKEQMSQASPVQRILDPLKGK